LLSSGDGDAERGRQHLGQIGKVLPYNPSSKIFEVSTIILQGGFSYGIAILVGFDGNGLSKSKWFYP
jgi:hypothetical protein